MKEIITKSGHTILVDDADFELVSEYTWCAGKAYYTHYAKTKTRKPCGKRTTLYMHRLLLTPPKALHVDHVNGNGLDNRRENLRICTNAENTRNQRVRADNVSGFKGVYSSENYSRWRAKIRVGGKLRCLGSFYSKEEAARAYDEAALKYFGEFAKLNFPLEIEECV